VEPLWAVRIRQNERGYEWGGRAASRWPKPSYQGYRAWPFPGGKAEVRGRAVARCVQQSRGEKKKIKSLTSANVGVVSSMGMGALTSERESRASAPAKGRQIQGERRERGGGNRDLTLE